MTKLIDLQRPIWHISKGKLNWDPRILNQINLFYLKKKASLKK